MALKPRHLRTLFSFALVCLLSAHVPAQDAGWPAYGNDPGGQRYSTAAQITPENVSHLRPVWTYHTHALAMRRPDGENPAFETTPVLGNGTLYLTTPYDVVIALNPATGAERWTYDPHIVQPLRGGILTSRGVALWQSPNSSPTPAPCSTRVLLGTLDARLLALDAATGRPCADFGNNGAVDLTQNIHFHNDGLYAITSPPLVLGNTVVVGSCVGDNQRVDPESGLIRAFDVVTGKPRWSWEPLPWAQSQKLRTGAGNAWGVLSADPALGLVYLPTGSPAPDYYGGLRPGDNRDADSIVALNAATGKKVWAFQVVHHDLWDYDIPSQPLLFTFRGSTPAVAVTTKMGMVFVLDRRNGQPLYPVEERPVPKSDVPGEHTSPTQPFQEIPALTPLDFRASTGYAGWQRSAEDQRFCDAQLARLRYDGIYTPPSLAGTLAFPGNVGGVNWGGAALDPATGILYANVNRNAFSVRFIPRYGREMIWRTLVGHFYDWANWGIAAGIVLFFGTLARGLRRRRWRPGPLTLTVVALLMLAEIPIARHGPPWYQPNLTHFGHELSPQRGAPYLIERDPIVDHEGRSCTPLPWGVITAINLNTASIAWQRPLGSTIPGQHTGILSFGGPIVTAAGLVFTGAAQDGYLRAFDAHTGDELWTQPLPAPAESTPMTYTLNGRQFLVVAAGGHSDQPAQLGDSLIAFALEP